MGGLGAWWNCWTYWGKFLEYYWRRDEEEHHCIQMMPMMLTLILITQPKRIFFLFLKQKRESDGMSKQGAWLWPWWGPHLPPHSTHTSCLFTGWYNAPSYLLPSNLAMWIRDWVIIINANSSFKYICGYATYVVGYNFLEIIFKN